MNNEALLAEFAWLEKTVKGRFSALFEKVLFPTDNNAQKKQSVPEPPQPVHDSSEFHRLLQSWDLNPVERLLLALCLVPHVRPDLLHTLFMERGNRSENNLVEAGGIIGHHFRGFLPTGLTFLFIAAGRDSAQRLEILEFLNSSILLREKIVSFGPTYAGEPYLSGPLVLEQRWLERILSNGASALDEPPMQNLV